MLSIVCQHWGDWGGNYAALYVQRLRDAVRRNLGAPHRFVCMMDGAIASTLSEMGIDTLPLGSAELPGNLRKLDMYRPDNGLPAGRVLALDLDTVVTGNLEDIAGYDGRFCVLEDFYEPGRHGGAVVAFEAVTLAESLYNPIARNAKSICSRLNGSERQWYREQMAACDFWQQRYPRQIVSAKPKPARTVIDCVPRDARLVCFHGQPRPHQVNPAWLEQHWH